MEQRKLYIYRESERERESDRGKIHTKRTTRKTRVHAAHTAIQFIPFFWFNFLFLDNFHHIEVASKATSEKEQREMVKQRTLLILKTNEMQIVLYRPCVLYLDDFKNYLICDFDYKKIYKSWKNWCWFRCCELTERISFGLLNSLLDVSPPVQHVNRSNWLFFLMAKSARWRHGS